MPNDRGNSNPTFTLLIATLNEADSLPAILPLIKPEWVDKILFVDGGSNDGTVDIIKKWGHGDVFVQTKPSLAMAYFESFPRIQTDYLIAFSPDGNSLPEAIPQLVQKVKEGGYDMVIASRYLPGAGSEDDDPMTSLGNWMFTTSINVLFGGHYTDSLVMYRAYRISLVKELQLVPRTHCYEPLLSIRCALSKCHTAEIPAFEPKRIGGVRKMRIIENGWAILKLIVAEWFRFLKLKLQRKI
jgi:glycosyltransferase involved in cell wall biosynthesis